MESLSLILPIPMGQEDWMDKVKDFLGSSLVNFKVGIYSSSDAAQERYLFIF